jgi:exonuclease III
VVCYVNPVSTFNLTRHLLPIDFRPAKATIFKGVKCAVLSVYSPTNVAARAALATQEQFYKEVISTYQAALAKYSKVVLAGDWNASIGQRVECWNRVSGGGLHNADTMNDNGARMLELCNTHRLRVGNTYFARGGASTWKRPRRRRWVTLDYCLYNNAMRKLVQDCRVLKSFQCHTDHRSICVCLKTERRARTSKATCTRKCTRIEE